MEDGLGCLIALAIIIGVISLIVMIFIYAAAIIAAIAAFVGFIYAIINLVHAIHDTVLKRKNCYHFKDIDTLRDSGGLNNSPNLIFEERAAKMYIFGPIFSDIGSVMAGTISRNFKHRIDLASAEKDSGFVTAILKIFVIVRGISIYTLGTLFSILLCALGFALCGIAAVFVYPIVGIILLMETINFKHKQINFRCPSCKKEFDIPKYHCPVCSMIHIRLKPGRYGIFKRRCLCGAHLPLVQTVNGYVNKVDNDGSKHRETITLDRMPSECPLCGFFTGGGLSRSISIALIGGTAAGKSTFKTAFENVFLDGEMARRGVTFSFPNANNGNEFLKAREQFEGKALVEATNVSSENNFDISTFEINLKHDRFVSDRNLQIYDLPGECFLSGNVRESWEHYSFSEGAVFLVDPFSIKQVAEDNEKYLQGGLMRQNPTDINALVESMISTLGDVKVDKTKDGKLTLPIAIVIGKCDTELLDEQCGDAAINRLLSGAPEAFSNKFDAMDYVCRCFLAKNSCRNFVQTIDNNFENVHFFSCSAMGGMPQKNLTPFNPRNVVEVMQWLIVRADSKNIGKVWEPADVVSDIPPKNRNLYVDKYNYYEQLVLAAAANAAAQ